MRFGEVPVAEAEGAILAHSLKLGPTALKKARVLSPADLELMAASGLSRIVVARLEPGDVGENEAARRIAEAAAGDGVEAFIDDRVPAVSFVCDIALHGCPPCGPRRSRDR